MAAIHLADIDLLTVFNELLDEAASLENCLTLDDVDFDQIVRLRAEIEYIDERLKSGKVRKVRKRNALFRREALEARLAELESGHDALARKLQIKAQALGALPREMRDAIFEQLYCSETPISPEISRFGPKTLFKMPKDPALYMSQRHVGLVIAEEAAEIFYSQNTFDFGYKYLDNKTYSRPWVGYRLQNASQRSQEMYDLFLDSDHYGSGVRPRDFVRKVRVFVPNTSPFSYAGASRFEYNAGGDNPRQITFEREYQNWIDKSKSIGTQYFDDREHLEYFLNFDGLQEFTIVITVSHGDFDSICRLINPIVRQLKDRRVRIKVINCPAVWHDSYAEMKVVEEDVSCFFDTPSPEDYTMFQQKHPAPIFAFDEKADPLDAWWIWTKSKDWEIVSSIYETGFPRDFDNPNALPPLPQAGLVRVWLHEGYEVFKFYQKHRIVVDKLNEMWDELKSFDAEEVAMRRRYYGRMMDLMALQR